MAALLHGASKISISRPPETGGAQYATPPLIFDNLGPHTAPILLANFPPASPQIHTETKRARHGVGEFVRCATFPREWSPTVQSEGERFAKEASFRVGPSRVCPILLQKQRPQAAGSFVRKERIGELSLLKFCRRRFSMGDVAVNTDISVHGERAARPSIVVVSENLSTRETVVVCSR